MLRLNNVIILGEKYMNNNNNPKITIILENESSINLELYPSIAPQTVNNILDLINSKFYDGLVFHRIIKDFMVQVGGYYVFENKILQKEANERIPGEFLNNGHQNELKHKLGVISMARTNDPNSASSQFFICTKDSPHLDGNYAAFGSVNDEESIKVLLELNNSPTSFVHESLADFPIPLITIKTINLN